MTVVVHQNVAGQARGEPLRLAPRRRRLSTIARRHAPAGRPYLVSVHRQGDAAFVPTDTSVRLRATWPRTLVGPRDVVVITVLPLGGGGGSGGGKATIGLALASIALIALAGPVGGALAGTLGATGAFAVQAGMVVGGLALSFAAQNASANRKSRDQAVYSVSGGGNLPKPGARKPLQYGRCWSSPPLSQPDYTLYNGSSGMTLVKRMTLGLGRYQFHTIRVGDALFWSQAAGIAEPFASAGAELELLFEQPSAISPGDVISSSDVAGQELPRAGANPSWTPWFRVAPPDVEVDQIQLDYQWPAGLVHNGSRGQGPSQGGIQFEYRLLDPVTGAVAAPAVVLHNDSRIQRSTTAIRATIVFPVVRGAYEVRAQNTFAEQPDYENRASWDGLRGWISDVRIRPQTSEIVMKIPAGPGLSVTSFSDVSVEASRLIPVWTGTEWSDPVQTSKAVWAFCDLVRAEYGLDLPDGVDRDRAAFYDARDLQGRDTYDGVLPEVSSYWEAASEVLGPFRADPVKVGRIHTFVRDESQDASRHVLSRRQIVESSGQAAYRFVEADGDGADVIVEFDWGGDPKHPDARRWSYGPATRTPKRYRVPGITSGPHALAHAKWLAAVAVFRGSSRTVTTEWDGRLVYPGDHILCDVWFLRGKKAFGIVDASGSAIAVDADVGELPADPCASIRRRDGREWGIVRVDAYHDRAITLNEDDLAVLSERTGLTLADVLAGDAQDPTTIVVGTLAENQETYVARSAIPADENRVTIEMVLDDTRIWQILGETILVPQPAWADASGDPSVPKLSQHSLHARCARIETGIEVLWSITPVRGSVSYEVQLSYDASDDDTTNDSWETLSFSESFSGRNPMHQSDLPVTVRARAYGRTGLAGPWVSVTFATTSPSVDGDWIEDLSVSIAKLAAQVRRDIERISMIGQRTLAEGEALIARGKDLIRDELVRLEGKLEELASAVATEAGDSYQQSELVKVAAQGRAQEIFGALQEEVQIRTSEVATLVQGQTVLGTRLTTAENTIVGQGVAIDGLQVSVTNLNGTVTVVSQRTTSLEATVNNPSTGVSATAVAVQQLTARVIYAEGSITATSESLTVLQSTVSVQGGQISGTAAAVSSLSATVSYQGGQITSTAQDITALRSTLSAQGGEISATATAVSSLSATVSYQGGQLSSIASQTTALQTVQGGHSSLLTIYGASIDGVRAEWGVAWAYDGRAVGGIAMTGMRKLDGSFATQIGILGDLVVTGTISGDKLQANNIITGSAQIGNLVVDNISIKDGAISQSFSVSSGATGASLGVYVRGSGKVLVQGFARGNAGTYTPWGGGGAAAAGRLYLYRDGVEIASIALPYISTSTDISYFPVAMATTDQPGNGPHSYSISYQSAIGLGGVDLVITELSK